MYAHTCTSVVTLYVLAVCLPITRYRVAGGKSKRHSNPRDVVTDIESSRDRELAPLRNTASPPTVRHDVIAPQQAPTTMTQGVSTHLPSHAVSQSTSEHVLTADARYPSHIQPAYQPLPHLLNKPKSSRSAHVPRTYADFLQDLHSKAAAGSVPKGWLNAAGANSAQQQRPKSYHSGSGRARGVGYESDVGYRSEGPGYGSTYHNGYISDGGYNRRTAGNKQHSSGYTSDYTTSAPPQHTANAVNYRSQKMSSAKHNGYASDFEAYSRRKELKHFDDRPLTSQFEPVVNNYMQYHTPNAASQSGHYAQSVKQRSDLRSDDVYELNAVSPAANHSHANQPSFGERTLNNIQENGGSGDALNGVRHHSHVATVSKAQAGAMTRRDEREGSSDDDRYRTQLYEASVRLQKSPNNSASRRRKQVRAGASQPRM